MSIPASISVPIMPPDVATTPALGRRLIPQIVDDLASTDPERTVYSITSLNNNLLDFRHITARQFANAIDKTAWWLVDQLGTSDSIQAIGYIGQREFEHSEYTLLYSLPPVY